MAGKKKKTQDKSLIARNRKATFEYHIEDRSEAGLVLEGWEVKSLRAGKCQIVDSHVLVRHGELHWLGGQITPLLSASTHVNPEPTRTRKLLLHRREIDRLIGAVERQGYTLIPLRLYWKQQRVKMELCLAKGKKLHDKRASERERDWSREKNRVLKQGVNT